MARGAIPSPNIWKHTSTYEVENHAFDRGRLVESTMRNIADWSGRDFLDLGCGSGFHLPRWALPESDLTSGSEALLRDGGAAATVTGIEPHPDLARLATRRTRAMQHVNVLAGTAQQIPLPDASVDIVQARWAYFFGPGCEPGLRELDRVVRRGGAAFVIDNDATRSTFGGWFRQGYPDIDPEAVERFWSRHGWQRRQLDLEWSFADRGDFEDVVRIEFDPPTATAVIDSYLGTSVDYAINLWFRHF